MRIIEAYQVPEGNVSPDIFRMPCVSSAYKTMRGETYYHVDDGLIAGPGDWICRDSPGQWHVLTHEEYQRARAGQKATNITLIDKEET